MKILLIDPSINRKQTFALGLAYLAAVLEHADFEVKILDASDRHKILSDAELLLETKNFNPDIIGMTLNTVTIKRAYRLLAELKHFEVPLLCGGPHATDWSS